MKEEQDKILDDLFKKGLQEPIDSELFDEAHWLALEQMLEKPKKKRGIVFWLPILSTAAVLLVIFGLWLLNRGPVHTNNNKPRGYTLTHPKNNGVNTHALHDATVKKSQTQLAQTPANALALARHPFTGKQPEAGSTSQKRLISNNRIGEQYPLPENKMPAFSHDTAELLTSNQDVSVKNGIENLSSAGASPGLNAIIKARNLDGVKSKPGSLIKKSNQGLFKHPVYALTFLGGSNLNGVNSFQQTSTGSSYGLLFYAGVSNKLTISTGASYYVAPYNTAFGNYHTEFYFASEPLTVDANCRVLDIPVNLDYQLYNKHRNRFSIGTGLSSYIMLRENYTFLFADNYYGGTGAPIDYTVKHTNKYFFGVANFQATYERQINYKFGISVQPYLKLPLTGIGAGSVGLQTTGIAVGVKWNLNSLSKP